MMRVGWVVGLGLGIQTGEETLVRELERNSAVGFAEPK